MLVKCISDTFKDPIEPTGEKKQNIHYCSKAGVDKIFLCSPRLHLFDQKYSKNSNITWHYYNLK